jgi:hypothetical protein
MKRIYFLAIMVTVLGASCSYPVKTVTNGDTRASIAIIGAAKGDALLVDGVNYGLASEFNGEPNTLQISSGTHRLQVKNATGALIHEEKFFIESDLKTIYIGGRK